MQLLQCGVVAEGCVAAAVCLEKCEIEEKSLFNEKKSLISVLGTAQSDQKEITDARSIKSIAHKIRMRVLCSVDSQIPQKTIILRVATGDWSSSQRIGQQKDCVITEGNLMEDHVHMLISIPPKRSVADVIGYIKGKSAIYMGRNFSGRKRNFTGESFWARGYYVSTVGRDEKTIHEYIKNQEKEDQRIDQLCLYNI